MQHLKRYGRILRRTQVCPRRRHRTRPESRAFSLSDRETYLLFGWGHLPYTEPNGQHYLRLRRYRFNDPCLPRGLYQRQAIGQIIFSGERRQIETEIWRSLLQGHPTHVFRFGWQTPIGSHYDILYLPLSFTFNGFWADGLAKDFGLRFIEVIQRNTAMTWRLCPSTKGDAVLEAAVFWLGATFAYWLEADLGVRRQHI